MLIFDSMTSACAALKIDQDPVSQSVASRTVSDRYIATGRELGRLPAIRSTDDSSLRESQAGGVELQLVIILQGLEHEGKIRHQCEILTTILGRAYTLERWRSRHVRIALAGIKSESNRDLPTAYQMDGMGFSVLNQMDENTWQGEWLG
jgi:hypothetical protein